MSDHTFLHELVDREARPRSVSPATAEADSAPPSTGVAIAAPDPADNLFVAHGAATPVQADGPGDGPPPAETLVDRLSTVLLEVGAVVRDGAAVLAEAIRRTPRSFPMGRGGRLRRRAPRAGRLAAGAAVLTAFTATAAVLLSRGADRREHDVASTGGSANRVPADSGPVVSRGDARPAIGLQSRARVHAHARRNPRGGSERARAERRRGRRATAAGVQRRSGSRRRGRAPRRVAPRPDRRSGPPPAAAPVVPQSPAGPAPRRRPAPRTAPPGGGSDEFGFER